MSLNIDMKMILSSNCSGSHCRFPLELHRFSIDAIQIFQKITNEKPFKFLLSSFVRVLFYTPKQKGVGEDVGFDIRDLIDFVTQQACRAPCVLFE